MKDPNVNVRRTTLVIAGTALLAAGAAITYVAVGLRSAGEPDELDPTTAVTAPAPDRARADAGSARGSSPEPAVTLTPEQVDRAGIRIADVELADLSGGLRLPGVVEPHGYRQVTVTPLVAGRITRVLVQLGDTVRRGQTMAEVFSPELAEAHTRYTAARAELDAHERELRRTGKLVEIGAASRQELERVEADHQARAAELRSARARLELLGVGAAALDDAEGAKAVATAAVPAPIAGVVTERNANVGLNVDSAASLFTVVDLSSVWVVADLYERDFSRVRVGMPARVTTTAYPDTPLMGRVTYIDPQVSGETRTARVRVEVPNPGHALRLGMYADVHVEDAGASKVPAISRAAVQIVGERPVVYLSDPGVPGRFVEREVRLGRTDGNRVEVLSGVQPGDRVVVEGSFLVRAERERLGVDRAAEPAGASAPRPRPAGAAPAEVDGVQTATIVVDEQRFEPARVSLRAGVPARLTFLRIAENTCATEVVFPALGIRRSLPLDEPITIELTPSASGDIAFTCGMRMLHGAVVVQ